MSRYTGYNQSGFANSTVTVTRASSGGATSAKHDSDPVSLYLPFDSDVQDTSANNHTVTASGSAAISSTQAKFGSNSLFLDASGDFLTIPGHEGFNFGTGDFTIEMFIRPDTINTTAAGNAGGWATILDYDASTLNGAHFTLHQKDQTLAWVVQSAVGLQTGNVLSANTWHHVVVARVKDTTTIYCDGINVGSFTDSQDYDDSATRTLYIGKQNIGSTRRFDGYIDDLRITKGVARYTKNFIPPNAAVGATLTGTNETNTTTDFTEFYAPFNSNVNDASSNAYAGTAGNGAAISSTQSKFGGYSLALDGTNDYVYYASSSLALGSEDFTIEAFIYDTKGGTGYREIVNNYDRYNNSGIPFLFRLNNANGQLSFSYYTGSWTHVTTGTGVINENVWHHVAAVRVGDNLTIFIDGVEHGTTGISNFNNTNARPIEIGSYSEGYASYFGGYIDDVRILKGYGKYRANFSVPTSAVGTSVSETVNDLTTLYMPFDLTIPSTTVASSQVEIYVPFESDFGDDGPNSLTLTEGGGGASSGRDVLIDTAPGSVPFGTNAAHFDNSSYSWNAANSGNLSTSRDVDFGTNDFTIEFWAYILSSQTNHAVLISTWTGGGWVIQIDGNSSLKFYDSAGNLATSSLPRNQWVHFAVVRASGLITWYVNGSAETTRTNSGNINGIGNLTFGSYPGGVGGYNGWLKDVRIINGTAVYTSDFSVPTAAHGGTGTTTVQASQGGFEDQARNRVLVEETGSTAISTSFKKFGLSSLFLDGNSDRAVYNGDDIALGNKDFTMECWFYMTASAGTSHTTVHTLFGKMGGASTRGFNIQVHGTTGLAMQYSTNGAQSSQSSFGFNLTPSLNTWHHMAVVRRGGTLTGYLDGTAGSSTHNIGSDSIYDNGANFEIGYKSISSGGYFPGYIDDLRIIIGHAVYTANFTPPASAHGHVSLQADGSTSETYSDTKFLSGIWDITDVRDKMMQSTWVSNDSRLPNGAGLQVQGGTHRWSESPGLSTVTMNVIGAAGGQRNPGSASYMRGGYSTGTIDLAPGTSLNILVGQGGRSPEGSGTGSAYGGGASGGGNSAGGGGYSGVFEGPVSQGNALLIAGGGGGGGYGGSPNTSGESPGPGTGDGGGEVGGRGTSNGGSGGTGSNHRGGYGGTQSAGGNGGSSPSPNSTNDGKVGSALQGGLGSTAGGASGGGGGGGYFGGGGGAWKGSDGVGGGGGGSGYVNPSVTGSTTAGGASGSLPTALSPGSYGIGGANSDGNPGVVEIIDGAGPTVYTYTGSLQTHTVA